MNTPEYIAAQIERRYREIEELYYSPICNKKGEIVSYQDWLDNY